RLLVLALPHPLTYRALARLRCCLLLFFFNASPSSEIYTLSLHDALPISEPDCPSRRAPGFPPIASHTGVRRASATVAASCSATRDRKSTRLNSSHQIISYAVFCLKKKKKNKNNTKQQKLKTTTITQPETN